MPNIRDKWGLPIGTFYEQVALGSFPHFSYLNLNAASFGIPAGNGIKTISPENTLYTYPTSEMASANSLSLASANANDIDGGSGVNKVLVSGLDTDFAPITEVVSMNGQTPAVLDEEFFRINNITTYTVGTSYSAQGAIYAGTGIYTAGVPATKYAVIPQNFNYDTTGAYTVPASHSLLLYPPIITFGFYDQEAIIRVVGKDAESDDAAFVQLIMAATNPTGAGFGNLCVLVSEKTDIQAWVSSAVADPDIVVDGAGYLIENSFWDTNNK